MSVCSHRQDVNSKVLPEYFRRGCHRAVLRVEAPQGVLPQQLRVPRLRPVHHGDSERQAYVHSGNGARWLEPFPLVLYTFRAIHTSLAITVAIECSTVACDADYLGVNKAEEDEAAF